MVASLGKALSCIRHQLYHTQVRGAHHTKTHEYIKRYLQNPANAEQIVQFANKIKMYEFPKTISTILKGESALGEQGLVTFHHAQPAAFTVAIKLATHLAIATLLKQKLPVIKNPNEFAVIRAPGDSRSYYERAHTIMQVLNDPENNPYPDWNQAMADLVLSITFSFLTPIPGESAGSFGLRHRSGKGKFDPDFAKNNSKLMIEKTLRHYGLAEKETKEILSSKELQSLLDGFNALRTGNFLIFGLCPHFAERFIYDSHRYGHPTQDCAIKVFHGLEGQERVAEHQARLLIAEETLDPRSPMTVLSSGDEEFIDEYARKHKSKSFVSPLAVKEFQQFLTKESSEIENDEIAKRKALLEQTERFCGSIMKKLNLNSAPGIKV